MELLRSSTVLRWMLAALGVVVVLSVLQELARPATIDLSLLAPPSQLSVGPYQSCWPGLVAFGLREPASSTSDSRE